jgi:hypothetical protein
VLLRPDGAIAHEAALGQIARVVTDPEHVIEVERERADMAKGVSFSPAPNTLNVRHGAYDGCMPKPTSKVPTSKVPPPSRSTKGIWIDRQGFPVAGPGPGHRFLPAGTMLDPYASRRRRRG